MKMLLIPDALQVCTQVLIFSLLSKTVLAVLVTQTPLKAFTSHTGTEGGGGGGGLVLLPSLDLEQETIMPSEDMITPNRKRLK